MVNIIDELIVSEASTQEQKIYRKHDTRDIFNCFENYFKAFVYSNIHKFNCAWPWIDEPLKRL